MNNIAQHHPLVKRLRKVAPNIVVTVESEDDHDFIWGGAGPAPDTYPQQVTVTVTSIQDGDFVHGRAYLGGCYEPDEHEGDVNGYLPQMIQEALEDTPIRTPERTEAIAAVTLELRRR